ncbi:hypothetical protein MJO29_007784 [Puccinia striiformis f. sp. tritici]|nr:hypothetical protein MJO29_007784 [Puccinia striiformis f. sp. tritici]
MTHQVPVKVPNYPLIPGMTTVPFESVTSMDMDIDPMEAQDPTAEGDPSMDIVPTTSPSVQATISHVPNGEGHRPSRRHEEDLDRVPTLVQGRIEAPHLAVRALSERGLEPVQRGQAPQGSSNQRGKSEPGGELVPLTTKLERLLQQGRQDGYDIATWKDPQGRHLVERDHSRSPSTPTSQSPNARGITQGGGASLQAPQARLDLQLVHTDILTFRETLFNEIHARFMYLDEKIDLLHENNNTLSQFQTLSAATQKSLDNSLATANSMSIFSDILRTSLSATEENKKALDKTSAKLNNDFAKAFDKLHLNKDALRDILDKNRVMSASIDELQRSSERIIVSKDEEQDKYESLTSDIDSTHQLLQNVAVAVNDVSSSLANFQSESSATARESLVHSQNVQTQVSNLSESFHNDLNQLQNRLDSIHRELRSTYNSSNVTLAHHTTPSPHTSTTPNLAVPSSTYENSRSQPENNNANRTTASDLSKDAPKVKDWPKFTGEGEYNHVEFIKTIDMFQEDFELRDIDITGKFCLIFQHSAKKWYLMIRKIHGKQPWAWWKEQINTKWGNAAWVYRMEEAFDKAHFEPGTSKPLVWFSKQKDRLSAIFPDMSESGLHERILKKCGGDLEHAVKCRTNRSSSTEDIINALEDIVRQ